MMVCMRAYAWKSVLGPILGGVPDKPKKFGGMLEPSGLFRF